jgi:modulator of FtsH protease
VDGSDGDGSTSQSDYDVAVETAYNPAEWGTFAVGLTTASGALTGLVFVAVSIRVKEVLDDPFHRRRTESTFVILLAILTASLLVLIPNQGRVAVGIEMLVIGAALAYRTAHTWPVVRASLRREAVVSYYVGALAHVLLCLGAISLLVRGGGGLYVVAAALVLELVRALSDIWVLFSGITVVGQPVAQAEPPDVGGGHGVPRA